jgi:hypothetical protein
VTINNAKVDHVDVSLVANSGWSSKAIEWFGAGSFSHIDNVLPDWYCKQNGHRLGSLLGARSDHVGGQRPGVRIRPPDYENWPKRVILRVPCTPLAAHAWLNYGTAQLGKPYDTVGLLESFGGMAFRRTRRDWRDPVAWWCSELSARMGELGTIFSHLPIPVWKITPGDCALLYSAAGGEVIFTKGISYEKPPLHH